MGHWEQIGRENRTRRSSGSLMAVIAAALGAAALWGLVLTRLF